MKQQLKWFFQERQTGLLKNNNRGDYKLVANMYTAYRNFRHTLEFDLDLIKCLLMRYGKSFQTDISVSWQVKK